MPDMDGLYEEIINGRIARIEAEMEEWDRRHASDAPALFPMIRDTEHLKLEIRRNELQAILQEARVIMSLTSGDP